VKIVRIITRLNIGGPSIQATRLTIDLAARGYTTTLLHGRLGDAEGDMRYLLSDGGVDVRYLDSLRRPIAPLADARALGTILNTLRAVRPDIVHTHMAKAGLLGRIAALIYNRTSGRHRPARLVHTYHGHVLEGYFRPWVSSAFMTLERRLAWHTDALIAVSARIRDELVDRFRIASREKFHVVPLGFDLAPLAAIDDAARLSAREALQIPRDAAVVTTVGRLTAIKNHALLVDAGGIVAERTPNVVFLIAGDGELRGDLEARAAAALHGRVRFLGWRRDLATIYAATDVFALTSRNEGTPVALIEAMAAGVPGVATRVGGVPDVITDPGIGTLVAADDAGALAAAIGSLLASPQARREIGVRARASVVGRFDVRRLVDDIDDLYRSMRQTSGVAA
jgi:glycosyltransferase involved in cell wall biosynthesis